MSDTRRYVTFPMGDRRYALDSSRVSELLMPGVVYGFPHTMTALEGVLVRRGTVIPVCSLRQVFGQGQEPRLYVVVRCNYAGRPETVAIPVDGDCQLVQGDAGENSDDAGIFVAGILRCGGETLPLLDIDGVVAHCIQPAAGAVMEARQ